MRLRSKTSYPGMLLLSAAVFSWGPAHAGQDDKPHSHPPVSERQHAAAPMRDGWAETLNLKGDKAKQVREIEAQYHERRRELKKKHYAENRAVEKEKVTSLSDVLSPAEMAKLHALWTEQMKEAHRHH